MHQGGKICSGTKLVFCIIRAGSIKQSACAWFLLLTPSITYIASVIKVVYLVQGRPYIYDQKRFIPSTLW